MADAYDFDPNKMTTREIIELEEMTGRSFEELFSETALQGSVSAQFVSTAAIYYLVKRRAGEAVTWDEALDVEVEVLGDFLAPMAQAPAPAKQPAKRTQKRS